MSVSLYPVLLCGEGTCLCQSVSCFTLWGMDLSLSVCILSYSVVSGPVSVSLYPVLLCGEWTCLCQSVSSLTLW